MTNTATTEDQIIVLHTKRMFQQSSWNIKKFTEDKIIPALRFQQLELEHIDFATCSDTEHQKWVKAKRQKVARIIGTDLDGPSTPFPLHWKWLWISCLDEPYRSECRSGVLAVAGVLDIPLPDIAVESNSVAVAGIGDFMRQAAEVITAASPAADGVYCSSDSTADATKLANELHNVINVCLIELQRIKQGTGCIGDRALLSQQAAAMFEKTKQHLSKTTFE